MQDRTDEFGAIAKSLEGFRKNAEERVALEEKTQNLQKKAEHERSSMLTDLTASFEQSIGMTVQSLTNHCSQLANVSESLGKKSEQGGNRSLAVAEATITTSQEVDTVAQTGSELSSTIQEISARVAETTSTMRAVVHEVDDAATRIETLQMASQVKASRLLQPKSKISRYRPKTPLRKSRSRFATSKNRRALRLAASAGSRNRSAPLTKSSPRSLRRSKNNRPRPRRFPARCKSSPAKPKQRRRKFPLSASRRRFRRGPPSRLCGRSTISINCATTCGQGPTISSPSYVAVRPRSQSR